MMVGCYCELATSDVGVDSQVACTLNCAPQKGPVAISRIIRTNQERRTIQGRFYGVFDPHWLGCLLGWMRHWERQLGDEKAEERS